MPMWEITVESKTRVEEHGHTVLYETKYRGLQEDNGMVHYFEWTEDLEIDQS